jgi:uncharacterized DUF497 family protein
MRFAWDPAKSDWDLRTRGFDFAHAARIFEGRTVEVLDDRTDYGEHRWKALGTVDAQVLVVVYADRQDQTGKVRRIISARVANAKERKSHEEEAGD